ncbi:Protein GVQW1, partial [Plecturocebus cupreus]
MGMHHKPNVCILVEMVFCRVAQADLKLLSSSSLPTLASQNAGPIGISHCTQSVQTILIYRSINYGIHLVRIQRQDLAWIGLKLPASSDLLASASQSTGILGGNHGAWLPPFNTCFLVTLY